jgi:hypothetical protein
MKKYARVLLMLIASISLATVMYAGPSPGEPPKFENFVHKSNAVTCDHSLDIHPAVYDVGKPGDQELSQLSMYQSMNAAILPVVLYLFDRQDRQLRFFLFYYDRSIIKRSYPVIRPPTLKSL